MTLKMFPWMSIEGERLVQINTGVGQIHEVDEVKALEIQGLQIRRAEPDDCSAIYEMFSCQKVFAGTVQLPYLSHEQSHPSEGDMPGLP